eukprot:364478-Chlamydomonas_euryale.AAC.20
MLRAEPKQVCARAPYKCSGQSIPDEQPRRFSHRQWLSGQVLDVQPALNCRNGVVSGGRWARTCGVLKCEKCGRWARAFGVLDCAGCVGGGHARVEVLECGKNVDGGRARVER